MFDTLDKLLLKDFLLYFLFILILITALFVGVDFLSKFWSMNMLMGRVLQLYLYKIPSVIQQFVPVACLMAVMLVLSTMSRQNEILALYASGVGSLRLVSTFVAAVATISTVSFLTFDSLVPALAKRQIQLEKGLDPSQSILSMENRSGFWYRSGNLIYSVGNFNPSANLLEDVKMYVMDEGFNLRQTLKIPRALYESGDWSLTNGTVVEYPKDSRFPLSSTFEKKTGMIPEKPTDYRTLSVQEETMRLKELRRYIHRNSSYGLDTTGQKVAYHERIAMVFTPLIFILLAIPFSIAPLKRYSNAKSIAFCFVIVFIFLLMFRFTLSVGRGGHLPAAVAAWLPNALFLGVGLFLLQRRSRA